MANEPEGQVRLFALLVGIDEYLTERDLRGCVNDVEAMRVLLTQRFRVPAERIKVLTNEQATRRGVVEAFQSFLIDNEQIRRGDQILVHYSGHGSRMRAAPEDAEPDGYNETLVPHDSRTADVFDIPDKTLAALLEQLADRRGDQITVILDSCHSGHGTRRPDDPAASRVRRVPTDERVPPATLDADVRGRHRAQRRNAGPSGWASPGLSYVLLAGCRDREESNEHEGRFEDGASAWHGALTYFTLQTLGQLPEGSTYAELHERVAALVNASYPTQNPQCEGDRDRQIFGGARVQRDPFVPVRRVAADGRAVTLAAGLVHGLRPGTKLGLYPPEVRTRDELPRAPLATVEVVSVGATTAEAEVQGSPSTPIPVFARGVITEQVYAGLRQTVALEVGAGDENRRAAEALREAIESAGLDGGGSPYLELVDDPARPVDLRVKAEAGRLGIHDDRGEPLVVPEDLGTQGGPEDGLRRAADATRHALESIVRFRTVITLANEQDSDLAGKVKLRLRRFVSGSDGPRAEDLPPGSVEAGSELTVYYDPDPAHAQRNLYVVDVINESGRDVYPHVFILSPDFSISRLYPNLGGEEALGPTRDDRPFTIGLRSAAERLKFWLPPNWDAARDYLKAIVTTVPADLKLLEQKGLKVPAPGQQRGRRGGPAIEQLLGAVAFGSGTRHGSTAETWVDEDWTTTQLRIDVVRRYQAFSVAASDERVALGDGLSLETPAGFAGEIRVTTVGQAVRGAEGDPDSAPPPGLENLPELFQPVSRAGTRGAGRAGLVVAFDVDEASRQLITSETPLRLEVPAEADGEAVDLLPVIFDGEDYLLAGHAGERPNVVEIVTLPPAAVPTDAAGRPTKRGIGRTIRLFVYKKLGRHTTLTGLRRAALVDGRVTYEEIRRDQFRAGQRVALFVHGFTSDTGWMVRGPARFLREAAPHDHVLTWDYETFGTGVEQSGADLALALRQQGGFGPDDGVTVDVIAHSMGGLVARCMIELSEGYRFVDRAVLAGTPNRGTTLATVSRGAVYAATLLLNGFSSIPVVGALGWPTKALYKAGLGWADLAVDSPLVKRLNALDAPTGVPYLVLAGDNTPEGRGGRLDRIARKVLDRGLDEFFGEDNDVFVGLSSIRGVRGGAYPDLTVEVLPCDHFEYFGLDRGREALARWLTG